MEPAEFSLNDASKLKQNLLLPSDKGPDRDSLSFKTPDKPVNAPRRSKNCNSAFSLKEIRQAAQNLRKSDPVKSDQPDPFSSSSTEQTLPESPFAMSKKPESSVKLPEKYELLEEFFNSFDSSIRLLRLKGSMATLTNISLKVESLTDRRFSHRHLAQMKFILPEAIEIKKILTLDERTSCMKPDLHVTLNASAIEDNRTTKSGSGNLVLRKAFRARLFNFAKAHPEGDDIPEEELPEPFNGSKHETLENAPKLSSESDEQQLQNQTGLDLSKPPASASHLSEPFRPSFSQPNALCREENAKKERTIASTESSSANSRIKLHSEPTSDVCSSNPNAATPVKDLHLSKVEKGSSTPAKLMSSTPALQPPKRCYMTPEDDSAKSPNKLVRRPSRCRLVFDTPTKKTGGSSETGMLSIRDDILPENLLQSIREKERRVLEEKDPAISRAKWRKQMVASLPKLFDTIYFLFQSIKRSVITKELLMHRIISSQLEIVDSKIEEQLRLLHELAPEWIYEKPATSGDLLICVNKIRSPVSIRAKLADAN